MSLSARNGPRRCPSGWLSLGLVAALVGGSAPAGAVPAGAKAGAWNLVLDDNHQCRLTLSAVAAGPGFALAMPVGCRRALPVLTAVTAWSEGSDGEVRLDDASGTAVVVFEPGAGGLAGTSPQGEIYRLRPIDAASRAVLEKVAAAPAPVAVTGTGSAGKIPAARKAAAPKAAEVAGRYAVLRDKAKDTGCMVTLEGEEHGPKATFKARLAPACRDQGIVIFDPVGWQIEAGRLVLTARKGHTTRLDFQEDGSWLKDPKDGKGLSLKKMM